MSTTPGLYESGGSGEAPSPDFSDHVLRALRSAFDEWARAVEGEFGSGTWEALDRSHLALFLHSARGHRREADLDTLARALVGRWRMHDPEDRERLRALARERGRSIVDEKVALARMGLLRASMRLDEPQRIRLVNRDGIVERTDRWAVDSDGVAWLRVVNRAQRSALVTLAPGEYTKDAEGEVIQVRPQALPARTRLAWYAAAAKRLATAELRGETWEGRATSVPDTYIEEAVHSETDREVFKVEPTGLDALVAAEEHGRKVAALLDAASPQQREILTEMLELLKKGYSETEARATAAANLGIAPATLRVQLHRLRDRV